MQVAWATIRIVVSLALLVSSETIPFEPFFLFFLSFRMFPLGLAGRALAWPGLAWLGLAWPGSCNNV